MIGTPTKPSYIAIYDPLPWQIAAWRDKARVCLYTGSAGGGKSRAAAEKLHGFMLKYPGAVGIGLRKAREFASKSVRYALEAAIGATGAAKFYESDFMFRYTNGSKIFLAGMKDEGQRQALRSINGDGAADFIWVEEASALTEDDHNELLGRLRGQAATWRQLLYTTNPDHPYHWIKLRLIDGGEASLHYSSAADNPYLPDEYQATLAQITGTLGLRLREGKWVQSEGAIYDTWDTSLHMIDAMPEGWHTWRKLRVIDFGYVNPFVCQWWAVDNDDRAYRYRELYMTGRTVAQHAEQIKLLSQGESYEATICDHDAEDRATLRAADIPNVAAKKDVSPGIQAVKQRLVRGGDDRPRLFLLRGALVEVDESLRAAHRPYCTEHEFPGYVWQTTADGKPDIEQPLKLNDHGMDALRYLVMYLDVHQAQLQTQPDAVQLYGSRLQTIPARRGRGARSEQRNFYGSRR